MRSINIANYNLPEGKKWQLADKTTEFHDDHGQYYEITTIENANDKMASTKSTTDLIDAVEIVNNAIDKRRKELEEIAKTEEADPILIEGETTAGYPCQMMVDPKDVAKIALEYDYPVWETLLLDAPDGMWEDLARKFGLAAVGTMDL